MKLYIKQLIASVLLLVFSISSHAELNLGSGVYISITQASTASAVVPYQQNYLNFAPATNSQSIVPAGFAQATYTGAGNSIAPGHMLGGLNWARMNKTGSTVGLMIANEGKLENLAGTISVGEAGDFQLSQNCSSCSIPALVLVNSSITGNAGTLPAVTHFLAQAPGNTGAMTTEVGFGMIAPTVGTGITNLYGVQIPDLTATNVYGIYTGINAGTGKIQLYLGGSAPSYSEGPFGTLNGSTLGVGSFGWGALYLTYTNTATVGAVTMNVPSGRVNIAAAGTSIVVTDSIATAASHIFAQASTADVTCMVKNTVPAAGSFTITMTAGCTAQTTVNFFIVNAD